MPDGLHQIIHGCIQGDTSAQSRLYDLYCTKMLAVCQWYSKNKEEAEEILQDGFVRVFTYLHTYNYEGSLEGWIRRIMINSALMKFRNKKDNFLRDTIEYQPQYHDKADTASILSGYDEKALLKLIQLLPPMYRMVFSLHVLEGYTHKETAARLGISEGTSKSNLSDARAILQKKIFELHREPQPKIK